MADQQIASLRAAAHPLRLRILSLLTGSALSAAEIARELDITHANASYHHAGLLFVAIPVGQLAFGPLGAAVGLQQLILFAGITCLTISRLTLLSGSVRTLDRVATEPDPEVRSASTAQPS